MRNLIRLFFLVGLMLQQAQAQITIKITNDDSLGTVDAMWAVIDYYDSVHKIHVGTKQYLDPERPVPGETAKTTFTFPVSMKNIKIDVIKIWVQYIHNKGRCQVLKRIIPIKSDTLPYYPSLYSYNLSDFQSQSPLCPKK